MRRQACPVLHLNQTAMRKNQDHCDLRRRNGLNTTAKFLAAGLAVWLGNASAAHAGSQSVGLQVVLGAASVGQAGSASTKEADELLAKARKAMAEGNLELADTLVARAEKLNPNYGVLHTGDTPKKARDELRKKLAARSGAAASGNASSALAKEAKDPFAAAANEARGSFYAGSDAATKGAASSWPLGSTGNSVQIAGAGPNTLAPAQSGGNPLVLPGHADGNLTVRSMYDASPRTATAGTQGVVRAGGLAAAGAPQSGVVQAGYDSAKDSTKNIPVRGVELLRPSPLLAQSTRSKEAGSDRPAAGPGEDAGSAVRLFQMGEQALAERDTQRALEYFRQAYQHQSDLEPAVRDRLQAHLQILSRPTSQQREHGRQGNLLEGVAQDQQVLGRQVAADVTRLITQADGIRERDPKKSLEMLKKMRADIDALVQLDAAARNHQLQRLDERIKQTEQYIQQNAAQIELDEKNRAIEAAVEGKQQKRIEIDEKMAALVEEFNRLVDEQRYHEAELVAKKAKAMDPENPVVINLNQMAKVLRRVNMQKDLSAQKEEGFVAAMTDVDRASIPTDQEYQLPNLHDWNQLTKTRKQLEAEGSNRLTQRERQIEAALKTPVLLKYDRRPLGEVLADLGKLADINIYFDGQGAAAEGASTDTPVSINLSKEVSLKSALMLILEQYRLNYVIENDVLKVTSAENTHGKVYQVSYPVGDLVIPIPNFVPDGREGINAALEHGYSRAGYGGSFGGFGVGGTANVVVADSRPGLPANPNIHAQMIAHQGSNNPPATGVAQPIGFGPGGLGGGSQADFDALIDLITTTIAPTTWDTVGGPGSLSEFETNLTLVVSQTQEVHEQIADLLQQLRRLQDLQVTIEVRFITLQDNFFERIGVDFDFNIDENSDFSAITAPINFDAGPSVVVGLDPTGAPTPNLNLQFRQGSFQSGTVPTFPGLGFDAQTAGNFGFAILSDIEAFFLIQAASGDTRSNILQAPKVTLFNGQTASISDVTQRPFVTSIIPVVGDFAAAHQPVIVVLSEGTSLMVQAVVSNDRRFVRLTVVPFFSQIGDVEEFTFTGSKTTTSKSSDSSKKTDDEKSKTKDDTVVEEGTTVQLPQFAFVSVTTTVSVPDGGTVLLGGIKRLSEGRNERGIPILSKIPYINRLFKNVGIGRTTSSLMMMVTPRIIIQEEEEEKLIGTPVP